MPTKSLDKQHYDKILEDKYIYLINIFPNKNIRMFVIF
jgi:hypothetical protein